MDDTPKLSAPQLADIVGVSAQTILRWAARGHIKADNVGQGTGNQITIDWHEIPIARIIKAVTDAGVQTPTAAAWARDLYRTGTVRGEGWAFSIDHKQATINNILGFNFVPEDGITKVGPITITDETASVVYINAAGDLAVGTATITTGVESL